MMVKYIVYVEDDNVFGGWLHAFKENTEALVVASKKTGLDVNAEIEWYMVMSRDQNAEWSRNLESEIISFKRVEKINYFGKALKYQNYFQEHNKYRE